MGLIAQAPPDWFDAERSLAFSAGIVARQLVEFCTPVADKMATQTIGAALAFKAGDPVEMALRTAFIQAIGLKYDERLTSRPRELGLGRPTAVKTSLPTLAPSSGGRRV